MKLSAGTPIRPGHKYFGLGLRYTHEQAEKLEDLKDPTFVDGIARKANVNKILTPDGTLLEKDEAPKMLSAVKKREKELMGEVSKIYASLAELDDDADASELKQQHDQALAKLGEVVAVRADLEDHIAQNRFLFIVDEHMVPQIYFQCATPDNPDLPPKKKEK